MLSNISDITSFACTVSPVFYAPFIEKTNEIFLES